MLVCDIGTTLYWRAALGLNGIHISPKHHMLCAQHSMAYILLYINYYIPYVVMV